MRKRFHHAIRQLHGLQPGGCSQPLPHGRNYSIGGLKVLVHSVDPVQGR
jgi:hypothetical protein